MMTKKRIVFTYLLLIVIVVLIGAAITFYRLDLRPFDPKLTLGLTALTVLGLMQTFWAALAVNTAVGFILGRPKLVLLWVPLGTLLVVLAHFFLGEKIGLAPLEKIGWIGAYLMYFTSVALLSLFGGVWGGLVRRSK